MSLNAVVYCDCVEKGRLTIPHPHADLLFINETGAPDISSTDPRDIEAHDRWESLRPCEHENFWLIERWLGNVSLVGSIRELLELNSSDPAHDYPVLWSKVIYDGSHSGDFLPNDTVQQLSAEVDRLNVENHHDDATPLEELLRKLQDLVRASRSVNKPISF
ncbi:MAG: hypothetical protein LC776_00050 [Acidobacteria bacterium]|nr:hypothetical protein [Acidobacteriota bacterium]